MFHALLFSVCSSLPQIPLEVVPPLALADQEIVAVLQASDSWFVAENRSEHVEVLFVGSAEIGTMPPVKLLPGVRLAYPFPRGTLGELLVELVVLDRDGWQNSGAFAIASLRSAEEGALWLTTNELAPTAWIRAGIDIERLAPQAELLPRAVLEAGARTLIDYTKDERGLRAPVHVPVIVPGGNEKHDRPPILEKKPLPPV
jgi:hypothetical protein